MGTTAPFGYRKDPQDKNHLIVDEVTAPTVRLIYSLALQGYGTNRIMIRAVMITGMTGNRKS